MKKETALEFFRLRVQAVTFSKLSQADLDTIEYYLNKAKQIEKEQIMSAYKQGVVDEADLPIHTTLEEVKYYNKTYEQ